MSRGDYAERQRDRDREYAEAWAKLSAKERRQLAKAGIEGPDLPVYRTGKRDSEEFIEHQAAPVEIRDEATHSDSGHSLIDVARRVIAELISQDNIQLTTDCLAVATGIIYDGNSMTEIARRHGISRAAVSKRCVEISNALDLPPTRAMRQLTARSVYERRARNCHSRNAH